MFEFEGFFNLINYLFICIEFAIVLNLNNLEGVRIHLGSKNLILYE